MPEPGTAFRVSEQDEVGLVELAGWTPAGLAAMFYRAGLPLPAEPGSTVRQGTALIARLTPSIAWLIDGDAGIHAADDGCAIDLSHGRVRLTLDGAGSTTVLAGVAALDLDAWPVGKVNATGVHGVPVLIHRAAVERFELLVPRSFVRSIRQWIEEAAPQPART